MNNLNKLKKAELIKKVIELEQKIAIISTENDTVSLSRSFNNDSKDALPDVLEISELQQFQDMFSYSTGVASIMIDRNCNPVTQPSNYSDLCRNIIEQTDRKKSLCIRCNPEILMNVPENQYRFFRNNCGLLEGILKLPYRNNQKIYWILGQVRDKYLDIKKAKEFARTQNINEDKYINNLLEIKEMNSTQFEYVCKTALFIGKQIEKQISGKQINDKINNQITKLKNDYKWLYAIVESTSDFISHSTSRGNIQYINQAGKRMLGWTDEDILKKRPIKDAHPAWAYNLIKNTGLPEAIEKGIWKGETALQNNKGKIIPVSQVIMSHKSTEGELEFISTIIRDISDRKKFEKESIAYIQHLEFLEQIDEVIITNSSPEKMLDQVIGTVQEIYSCDRAWLLYPCDPNASTWKLPFLKEKKEYAVNISKESEFEIGSIEVNLFNSTLESGDPLKFDYRTKRALPEFVRSRGVKSMLVHAIRPKLGSPWMLGLHHCKKEHLWTTNEIRLFKSIANRIADAISSLQFFRNLKDSENRYKSLVSNIPGVVFRFINDKNWTSYYVSEEFTALTGYKVTDLIAKRKRSFASMIFPQDKSSAFISVSDAVNAKQPFSLEFRIIDKSGNKHWVQMKGKGVFNPTGNLKYIDSIIFNVTEMKKVEVQLQDSQMKYKSLIETTDTGFVSIDSGNGRVLDANNIYIKLTGHSSLKEIINTPVLDWTAEHDRIKYSKEIKRCLKLGHSRNLEIEYIHGDGKIQPVEINSVSVETHSGTVIQMLCRDISERKKAEKELTDLRNLLLGILNSMPSAVIGVDPNCTITHWNLEAERLTGTQAEKALRKSISLIIPFFTGRMNKIQKSIKNGEIHKEERVKIFHDNPDLKFDIIIFPIKSNKIIGAVIRIDDVTHKVEMEEAMIHSEKMISVGGLAAGMAHKINNPIAGIIQSAQVLFERLSFDSKKNRQKLIDLGIPVDRIKSYIRDRQIIVLLSGIISAGTKASSIVSNMLKFSRKSSSEFSYHNVINIIENTISLAENDFNLKKTFDFKHISINREYAEHIPEIFCERTQIQQVFFNLFRNTVESFQQKKAKKPVITIRVSLFENRIKIEFEDNGTGIDKETIKRIFEPFFTTKPVGIGTGLGLSVSYFIITDNHSGSLMVESEKGKFTRFIITIPIGRK